MNELEEDPFAAEPDNENDAAILRRHQQLQEEANNQNFVAVQDAAANADEEKLTREIIAFVVMPLWRERPNGFSQVAQAPIRTWAKHVQIEARKEENDPNYNGYLKGSEARRRVLEAFPIPMEITRDSVLNSFEPQQVDFVKACLKDLGKRFNRFLNLDLTACWGGQNNNNLLPQQLQAIRFSKLMKWDWLTTLLRARGSIHLADARSAKDTKTNAAAQVQQWLLRQAAIYHTPEKFDRMLASGEFGFVTENGKRAAVLDRITFANGPAKVEAKRLFDTLRESQKTNSQNERDKHKEGIADLKKEHGGFLERNMRLTVETQQLRDENEQLKAQINQLRRFETEAAFFKEKYDKLLATPRPVGNWVPPPPPRTAQAQALTPTTNSSQQQVMLPNNNKRIGTNNNNPNFNNNNNPNFNNNNNPNFNMMMMMNRGSQQQQQQQLFINHHDNTKFS
jgi:hypothetical protein